ncbi:thiamine pyrophosphate-binding protein [Pseudonocardia sp. KRD-184]|uniref:Thiamine pyrophosphate-binding protein n=1 Tax=Pseudonocardia oceani TaxID=2792013 RepID=A0ABS6UCZ9_9PSEU|nr:thiamine pyrophosphate-binding protein [Pseudonocardia oceani]MBW0089035.1 thiamine pyrophosphate-binding protein [Pseudonocardia oceani]MBW0094744.1 thiamine pyrophosphate-binding protein [Pseudonocardia oceani]MBW0110740.1 thiamine pyrophosphate-binding protein [Pseudonocardia oceani]MBW0121366.1 thiamine pyrophosphate-binding protein [Pseudonocardia oceani]MBW0130116.1 thiamine pyrophosphate-binding protein [Pseudonocardia oceani]
MSGSAARERQPSPEPRSPLTTTSAPTTSAPTTSASGTSPETPTTVADVVGALLAELGVGHAFGVVGSGNFHVTNALRAHGVPFTAARHEGGAATMADAYARTAGGVAVLTLHQGCGLTNALTGITEAAKSRTPLLVLAADTAGAAVRSNFRIDQDALVASVGAVAERVHSAASTVADVRRAYATCRGLRRTVVLSLPLDVQEQPCESAAAAFTPLPPARPDAGAAAELACLLDWAARPVFVAGRGARGAGPELAALADTCGALLATSAVANGLFTGHDWSLGISGGFATDLAAELITDADLVVAWGASLTMWTTRHGALLGDGATVVQVDDTPEALGAQRPVDLAVLGDVRTTALDVTALVRGGPGHRTDDVRARIAAEGRWAQVPVPDGVPGRIDPRTLSTALDALLPAERTLAVDSGNFMGYPSAYLAVPDAAGFCFTQGFQSIGLGLATAIGAALARPDRVPVAALGDGGFLMGISELETAVRLGIGLLVVVYDDAGYGAEFHHFDDADHATVRFPDADLAAIAAGYGCDAVTVRSVDDLAAVTTWLAGPRDRPMLVDAKVRADEPSWWLAEAFRGH